MANFYNTGVYAALGTFTLGAPAPGIYSLRGKITIPRQSEGSASASQLVVSIAVNGGTPIYSGQPGADGFETYGNFPTINSVFNITFSSTATIDQQPNAFKATCILSELE